MQKPDFTGYYITGYYKPNNNGQAERIYWAELDNNLNLIPASVDSLVDLSRNQRPVKIEYIFRGGRFHKSFTPNGYFIPMGNGGNYAGEHDGYMLLANSAHTNGSETKILLMRTNNVFTKTTPYEITEGIAGNAGYTKVHNESNSCTPESTLHDIGTYIIQLPTLTQCFDGQAGIWGGQFAISCLFNHYRIATGCSTLYEYRDGDAAVLIWNQNFNNQFPGQCPDGAGGCYSGKLLSARNVAHLSGGDFRFISRPDKTGQYMISSGSTRDDGVIPPGGSTHFYTFMNKIENSPATYVNPTRTWDYAYQGNQTTGGCGFGLDIWTNGQTITSGNNTSNNHDAVITRLSHSCGVGTAPVEEITHHLEYIKSN